MGLIVRERLQPRLWCVVYQPRNGERQPLQLRYQRVPERGSPGISVFYKNETGDVFHTYSSYARGPEFLIGAYSYLDLVPKGRDEGGLPYTMAWIRHHDRYTDDTQP
jgi:predicted dithiol-disulfide oxidoreductase (DUF899 family)